MGGHYMQAGRPGHVSVRGSPASGTWLPRCSKSAVPTAPDRSPKSPCAAAQGVECVLNVPAGRVARRRPSRYARSMTRLGTWRTSLRVPFRARRRSCRASPPAAVPQRIVSGTRVARTPADFRPARKGHPGILVGDLDELVRRLAAAGQDIKWDEHFPGFRRVYAHDPFGNRPRPQGAARRHQL